MREDEIAPEIVSIVTAIDRGWPLP